MKVPAAVTSQACCFLNSGIIPDWHITDLWCLIIIRGTARIAPIRLLDNRDGHRWDHVALLRTARISMRNVILRAFLRGLGIHCTVGVSCSRSWRRTGGGWIRVYMYRWSRSGRRCRDHTGNTSSRGQAVRCLSWVVYRQPWKSVKLAIRDPVSLRSGPSSAAPNKV